MKKSLCKKIGRHFWLWPWQRCKRCIVCGAFQTLQAGENTITSSPSAGFDVLRWSGSQNALQAGDLGMDTATGRPQAYIHSANRDLIHIDESMAQIETIRVSAPTNSVGYGPVVGDRAGAFCITGMYLGLQQAPSLDYLIYLGVNGTGPALGNSHYIIEDTYGTPGDTQYSGNRNAIVHGWDGDFGDVHEGWFQTWVWVGRDIEYIVANTRAGVMQWDDGVLFSTTQHSYLRMLQSDVGSEITSLEIITDPVGFFQAGSRFTFSWWPMQTL